MKHGEGITKAVEALDTPKTIKEVQSALGWTYHQTWRHLTNAEAKGLCRRANGLWSRNEGPRPTVPVSEPDSLPA